MSLSGAGSVLRCAVALAFLLAAATTTLDPHLTHTWTHAGHDGTAVAVDARHAEEAAHFEGSELESRPGCLQCILQRAGAGPDGLRAEGPLLRAPDLPWAIAAALPSDGSPGLPASRAPPLS